MSTAMEAQQTYFRNQVQTASPARLLLMLYDGAIKFIGQAEAASKAKDLEKTNQALLRAQEIIRELMSSLNYEAGGEIAKSLYLLYDFMLDHLIQANVQKDPGKMQVVRQMLAELREAWEGAAMGMTESAQARD